MFIGHYAVGLASKKLAPRASLGALIAAPILLDLLWPIFLLLGWEQVMNLADAALYQAKQARNAWVGWGGTARATELPSLPATLAADPAAAEKQGFLVVRRGPLNATDTVDEMRRLQAPVIR